MTIKLLLKSCSKSKYWYSTPFECTVLYLTLLAIASDKKIVMLGCACVLVWAGKRIAGIVFDSCLVIIWNRVHQWYQQWRHRNRRNNGDLLNV